MGLERFSERMLLSGLVAFGAIEHQLIAGVLPLNSHRLTVLNHLEKPTSVLLSCVGGKGEILLLHALFSSILVFVRQETIPRDQV